VNKRLHYDLGAVKAAQSRAALSVALWKQPLRSEHFYVTTRFSITFNPLNAIK